MSEIYDVVVVGAGPGGYVAAIRASQLGLKVALIERASLGGICLNWGCIPTKALLRTSEIYHLMHRLDEFGMKADNITFDITKFVARSRSIATQLSGGIAHLMKKNKITVITGEAKLDGKSGANWNLALKDGTVKSVLAKNVILATGARARQLPGLESDGTLIWTSKEAMTPTAQPQSLLVLGSGAIGIEFASFYQTLGTKVTVVELQDRILPVEDEEISAIARKAFEKQGMTILTNTTVGSLKKNKDSVSVVLKSSKGDATQDFDRMIVAVGIVGNTENLGLDKTKVKIDKGQIVTYGAGKTDEPGLFAIGDVTGAPWLAHKASHEGVACAEFIKSNKAGHPVDVTNVPGCTYSYPQIASIGLTETKAKALHGDIKVGRFPFMANGKAIALGDTEGMVKTIFDAKTGELLGAHMIGAEVTEMIQGFAIAKTLEATEAELMETIFPHPTLSEMMHESVLNAYGRGIHL